MIRNIECLNDLSPVTLTSLVMKVFEKCILRYILNDVKCKLDPNQFAYKEGRNVEDACIIFVNNILKYLEERKSYVRILFVDFSSAFNTIQPHIMATKLLNLGVNKNIISWILEFLTCRKQYVKLNDTFSDSVILNTGAPQGCVLSPTLYTIYTNEYRAHHDNTTIIKFADDSVIQGFIRDSEDSYFDEILQFVRWCKDNHLLLNVKKTKEMIIDFRQNQTPLIPLKIENEYVDVVKSYKYLGFVLDNELNWHKHIDGISTKLSRRLFLLKKLHYFHISNDIIKIFYTSVVQSIITFGISCWGGNITHGDRYRIDRIIRRAEKIMKMELPSQMTLYEEYSYAKVRNILKDNTHPLFLEYETSIRSGRVISCKTRTERFKRSFVPATSRKLSQNKIKLRNDEDVDN